MAYDRDVDSTNKAAHGISAYVFFPHVEDSLIELWIFTEKCSCPVDYHVEDLGTSSMRCYKWTHKKMSILHSESEHHLEFRSDLD